MPTRSPPRTPDEIAARMDGIVRPTGDGGGMAFLPSPMVQNHAAFLLRGADGILRCAWFAGGLEGKADICIHLSELDAETDRWGPARPYHRRSWTGPSRTPSCSTRPTAGAC